ncbi:MAG: toprim domain-containing protein [Phocaeicola sp.]
MAELNYDDFKRRIDIQDLLVDAGYKLNRRDGLRYPSYVRMDSDGKRVRGDKFIVTGNGLCCFQPPEQKNYNVISFIKAHPHLFSEYTPGMNADRLVNLVCNRLLHNPITERSSIISERERSQKVFNIKDYEQLHFQLEDWSTQKSFYPYFKSRGIKLDTQKDFRDHFFIGIKKSTNGKEYTNLSFPMQKPDKLGAIVGLEERSRANASGKTIYKGMAAGSNATQGMWIANLSGQPLEQAKNIYWFESAFDAMAFYQIQKEQLIDTLGYYEDMQSEGSYKGNEEIKEYSEELNDLKSAVYVSTGGNPSIHQLKGMLAQTTKANHHLCFDRDMAGKMFAVNFLIAKDGLNIKTSVPEKGMLLIDTGKWERHYKIDDPNFSLNRIANDLDVSLNIRPSNLSEYMKTIRIDGDLMSGDSYLLDGDVGKAYGRYESLLEEYSQVSGPFSTQLCKDDLAEMSKEIDVARETFKTLFDRAYHEYQSSPKVIYEPCDERYKDWNDQLLDKKQYTNEDIIESSIDGDEGEYSEIKDDYEENKKKENSDITHEEYKPHFRR